MAGTMSRRLPVRPGALHRDKSRTTKPICATAGCASAATRRGLDRVQEPRPGRHGLGARARLRTPPRRWPGAPFCRECGTPLGFAFNDSDRIGRHRGQLRRSLARSIRPANYGVESKHATWEDTTVTCRAIKSPRPRA